MQYVVGDFETKSRSDLKKAGAWVYAEDPSTEVICFGYEIDGGQPKIWLPWQPFPDDLRAALDAGAMFIAHNLQFEKAIWKRICIPRHGWPSFPTNNYDTQASCARRALPLKLEDAGRVLRLNFQKDMEGAEALKKIMKPDKKGKFNTDPVLFQRVYTYCGGDVMTEDSLLNRLGMIAKNEMRVWRLNEVINERGIGVDIAFVEACQRVVDRAMPALETEFAKCTGGLTASQRDKVLKHIIGMGYTARDLKKETIEEYLERSDVPSDLRSLLELRGKLTSTSLAKLAAMRACRGRDGRARGLTQYHAATTGRFAGRLLQPQNFPKGTLELGKDDEGNAFAPWDVMVPAIMAGEPLLIELIGEDPIEAVQSSLRHALVAAKGTEFCSGDFTQIEARIVLGVAGAEKALKAFASGDPYCSMATSIYKFDVDKKIAKDSSHVDHQKHFKARNVGKNAVLGCGFQMAWATFQRRYAKKDSEAFCREVIRAYRQDFAPEVPKLWYALEEAATRCVWDERATETYGIEYRIEDEWLTCRLPSGRKLYYYGPRRENIPAWDGDGLRQGWSFQAKKSGQWRRIDAYGGLLTENVVQALARDLLCDRMFAIEAAGMPIVLTVHDEILVEVEKADEKAMFQIMTERPAWAVERNIPIAVEGWHGDRYRK